jgi:hypothetical protein
MLPARRGDVGDRLAVEAALSPFARSPMETIPTRRFSRLTTGRRRTFTSLMFCAMSSSSWSSKQ